MNYQTSTARHPNGKFSLGFSIVLAVVIPLSVAQAKADNHCLPALKSVGRSMAASPRLREKRARRRARRRWVNAVEGKEPGAKGAKPDYVGGTDYSNLRNARIISFNCLGRPLKCTLIAAPCRDN